MIDPKDTQTWLESGTETYAWLQKKSGEWDKLFIHFYADCYDGECDHELTIYSCEACEHSQYVIDRDEIEDYDADIATIYPCDRNGWIAVQDGLPETDHNVIVVVENTGGGEVSRFTRVDFCLMNDSRDWFSIRDQNIWPDTSPRSHLRVTHWQPAPQMPKTEE